MFNKRLSTTVYVKIYENRFVVKLLEDNEQPRTFSASRPFTTQRLLLGQFMAAEDTLKHALKQLMSGRWFTPSPLVVMHPMEKVEGGLSEVEERALTELAMSSGARAVRVWLGDELSDDEARGLF